MSVQGAGRRGVAAIAVLLATWSCGATRAARVDVPAPPIPTAASCRTDAVTWLRPDATGDDGRLDAWCGVVGAPVVIPAGAPSPSVSRIIVASWNVGVGKGQLNRVLQLIEESTAQEPTGVVLLIQEAYRSGEAVPAVEAHPSQAPTRIRPPAGMPDIEAFARSAGLSVAYVPSMRNGRQATPSEDRGNAILSTHPLEDVVALELPFGKQRRVAIAASITFPVDGTPTAVRVVSTHFDLNGDRTRQARALAGVLKQEPGLVLAGGDLNTISGVNDDAYLELADALPVRDCGCGRTNAWPGRLDIVFGFWLGRLDHLFGRIDPASWQSTCRTVGDFFGSDHRPVLLELRPAARSLRIP